MTSPHPPGVAARWEYAIEPAGRAGAENMAVDEMLLRSVEPQRAFLRLYRWTPACLSFGRNEPASRRYDRARIATAGVATVRRPTGGRAVWHADEVTYAVAGPADLFGSLHHTYIAIHEVLAMALRRLDVVVTLASSRRGGALGHGSCFAAPVGGELLIGDRKVCGSAQVRERRAFLQHGSLLLSNQQDRVHSLGAGAPPQAVALEDVSDRSITFDDTARAILMTARDAWGGSWTETVFEASDTTVARYRDAAWTWRR